MPTSFSPLAPQNPKILIVGSMPGAASLAKNQYYGYPQNRFWKILFRYFDAPFSNDYDARKNLLLQNGIALWDTMEACERKDSSLDSAIKNPVPNDIPGFILGSPSVQAVFTNGAAAAKMFRRHFSKSLSQIPCRAMPSTSPRQRMGFEQLYGVWKAALDEFLAVS